MSTNTVKVSTKNTKPAVAKPTTGNTKTEEVKQKVKPLNLQHVDVVPDAATPRMDDEVKTTSEVEKKKKVRKVEKTIGGLNLEQYLRALLARDPQIQLSAAFTTWDMIVEQIDNGELKNTSRSNKNKKVASDEPKQKRPYQLFGEWLKENNPEYKVLKVSEFSQIQSQLWKGPEGDEWKQENNYVEPASASKKAKKSTTEEPKSDKPKAKSAAVKPAAKKPEPVKKPVHDDLDSDVDAEDFDEAAEVNSDDDE